MGMPEPCWQPPTDPPMKELPPEVLEIFLHNPTRQSIIQLIQRHPGMNPNQIAETLQLNTSTVTYHLERLNDTGHVITVAPHMAKKRFCFTPDNIHLWKHKPFRVILGNNTANKVAMYLAMNPGATTKQIADDLEMSIPTVQRHIKKLQDAQLIQATRVDRHVFYHADPSLMEWMKQWKRKWEY